MRCLPRLSSSLRCFLVVQNFASRPQKIAGSKTHTKQNMQTRPNLSKTLGTLPARSVHRGGLAQLGWEVQNGNDEMLFSICFPLSLFISLFPAHSKTPIIILCRRLVIRTSCVGKTQVGVRRRKIRFLLARMLRKVFRVRSDKLGKMLLD